MTGRGGSTATKPVRLGYANLYTKLGLSCFQGAHTEAAKQVAKYGQGMPKVQKMADLRALAAFETITVEDDCACVHERPTGVWPERYIP